MASALCDAALNTLSLDQDSFTDQADENGKYVTMKVLKAWPAYDDSCFKDLISTQISIRNIHCNYLSPIDSDSCINSSCFMIGNFVTVCLCFSAVLSFVSEVASR